MTFQSTHPHGVRHGDFGRAALVVKVSIHAPTRGATIRNLSNLLLFGVSIHAPTRGATE